MFSSLQPHGLNHTRLPRLTITQSLLKFMSSELVVLSNHLILCHSLLLSPSIFPSISGLLQWAGSSHQVAKVLELQFQHQSFQWTFKLISFRIDWFDLFAVQGLQIPLVLFSSQGFPFQCSGKTPLGCKPLATVPECKAKQCKEVGRGQSGCFLNARVYKRAYVLIYHYYKSVYNF